MRTFLPITLLFLVSLPSLLQAQEATTTASGTGQAGLIILDWSIGELTLVNTVQNTNVVLTQGLHQGKLVAYVVSSSIDNGELSVTPNPTTGRVTVKVGFLESGQLSLRLFDATAKLLLRSTDVINAFTTKDLNFAPYQSGLYLLEAVFTPASGSNVRKRTYKIIRLP